MLYADFDVHPIVMVSSSERISNDGKYSYILKTCYGVDQLAAKRTGGIDLGPAADVGLYYNVTESSALDKAGKDMTLIKEPDHGKLRKQPQDYYIYMPDSGFIGQDNAVFSVPYKGYNYRVEVKLLVREYIGDDSPCDNLPHNGVILRKVRDGK